MNPPKRIGRNLHFRTAAGDKPGTWSRYRHKRFQRVNWLPSWQTYQRMAAIGWYPDDYQIKPRIQPVSPVR